MLVIVDVEQKKAGDFKERVKSLIKPYKISSELLQSGGVSVLYLKYVGYRGYAKIEKLAEYAVGCPKTILCSKEISLRNTPFKRFESNAFNIMMMRRYIDRVLQEKNIPPRDLRISVFDPRGDHPYIAEDMIKYSSEVTVVSNVPRFYENESDRLMSEYGVPLLVSNSVSALIPCDILICPVKIKIHLPTNDHSLIYTVDRPIVPVRGIIYTRYCPVIPEEFRTLCPESVDPLYFLSALYSLEGIEKLRDLIPIKTDHS